MCNIIQHGESFDLRINNMAFAQLSGSSINNLIHHFSNILAGGSRSHQDDYGSKGYKSTTPQNFEGYGGGSKSSYGSHASGSRNEYGGGSYGGSGSRGNDYGGTGSGSYGGTGSGHRVNMDSSSYKKPNESSGSRSRGWDDVKNAERA